MLNKLNLVNLKWLLALLIVVSLQVAAQPNQPSSLQNFKRSDSASKALKTCVDFVPYLVDEKGEKQWLGRHLNLMSLILEEAGLELSDFYRASFYECLGLMKSGGVDVMAGLLFTQERAEYMHLEPYTGRDPVGVFYLKGHADNIFEQAELLIAYEKGNIIPGTIKKVYNSSQFIDVPHTSIGLKLVEKERVDAFVAPLKTAFEVMAAANIDSNLYEHSMLSGPNDQVHVALSKSSKNITPEVKSAINKAIVSLREKGVINKILETKKQ